MGVLFMGGWASRIRGGGCPCACGQKTHEVTHHYGFELCYIGAGFCLSPAQSSERFCGPIKSTLGDSQDQEHSLITCVHFWEDEHMCKHDSDLM